MKADLKMILYYSLQELPTPRRQKTMLSLPHGILSRAAEFIVLLRKWAELQNVGFSEEIVQFLEILFKTNVFLAVYYQKLVLKVT